MNVPHDASPSPEQEPLFDMPQQTDQVPPKQHEPPRSFRTPEQDRVSEAWTDLGGGERTEGLAQDPPRFATERRHRKPWLGGPIERGTPSGADVSRDIANAHSEETPDQVELSDEGEKAKQDAKLLARRAKHAGFVASSDLLGLPLAQQQAILRAREERSKPK